jgi:hypothetical protein
MKTVEYDLHGTVGVRLIDPAPADVAAVDRQLGPIRGPLPDAPMITVRFVERLRTGRLSLVGVREAGFDEARFVVLRSSYKVPARVAIPMDQMGGSLEIVAERGLPAVPLLVAAINLAALHAGVLPLHAAAFVHRGRGIVVTGWSKGGKTETLLAALRRGAAYVGDEWVYLKPDGTMHGIAEPIRTWRWHLEQLPEVASRLPLTDRLRLGALAAARDGLARAPGRPLNGLRRVVANQLHADVEIDRLGIPTLPEARPELVCFVESWTSPCIEAEPISGEEVASRMAHSLAYERHELMARYLEYRFAFPARTATGIEEALGREAELLARLVAPVAAIRLRHPYPVNLDDLWEALAARLEAEPAAGRALAGGA